MWYYIMLSSSKCYNEKKIKQGKQSNGKYYFRQSVLGKPL